MTRLSFAWHTISSQASSSADPASTSQNQPAVVQARNLTKRYQDLVAVKGISFDIFRGECFGLLGPNGAGKTSTIKMINCTSPVTDGELWVDGKDVRRHQRAIKLALGVVSQADSLDPDLNVIQNLLSYGRFFNLPSKTAAQRAWETLDLFQLRDKANQKPDELSGGMRRRLLIARALLHEPRILLLDEPTTGLDPQSRLLVWEKLSYLKSRGITILLTTHYMEEASYLCDRLIVVDEGKILVEGSPEELVQRHVGSQVVEIRVRPDEKARLMATLQGRGLDLEDRGDSLVLYQEDGAASLDGLNEDDYRLTRRPGNLEDMFLRLTGRGLREE
jgi:lipooligosaccharide transport system ATP-binding protein